MKKLPRRHFVQLAASAGFGASAAKAEPASSVTCLTVPLDGIWQFRLDPENKGESGGWHLAETAGGGWEDVRVPHTWQVSSASANYLGVAWYRRVFEAPASWAGNAVRVQFEAVYHSASVWLNGKPVGSHLRKGYTAFCLDLSQAIRLGGLNTLVVRVDNSFDPHMLPRGDSYDWTPDGGIPRPVSLLVTPPVFVERVDVDALPQRDGSEARLNVRVVLRNTGPKAAEATIGYEAAEDDTGRTVLRQPAAARVRLRARARETVTLPETILPNPRLWHFDHPHLYKLTASIEVDGKMLHDYATSFGVRRIEVREGGFYLNGERVRLMGVERMAGSHPDFGMAEPASWIVHDHDDLKELNCVFTRVHWQQDRRVLDYCDRNGILIQVEVPGWGPRTFEGMRNEPSAEILQNGLEQLREMIERDRNHPCVFAWGLCNEVNGQNPAAQRFVRALYAEAKGLDPHRLLTYASNSLQRSIDRDIAGQMDFVEWNEYYESWMKGDVAAMTRNLEEIHRAFPDKMIVISEYGLCECRPEHTGGDPRRIEILREHNRVFREHDYVGGAIFFCYNDYRTHIGDKGTGVLKQRVHGVVDVYGRRKPSFEALRREASPVEEIQVSARDGSLRATVITRKTLPAYTLRGYKVRWILYAAGDLPVEQHYTELPELAPGQWAEVAVRFEQKDPERVRIDVVRPTGFSVLSVDWNP